MSSEGVAFFVPGEPYQQGSMRAVGGKVVHSEKKKLIAWRSDVKLIARNEMTGPPKGGPVSISMTFAFSRPKSHFGTGRNAEVLKEKAPKMKDTSPDLDKLVRAVLDALTSVVYLDDRQVVSFSAVKRYVEPGEGPGLTVTAWWRRSDG